MILILVKAISKSKNIEKNNTGKSLVPGSEVLWLEAVTDSEVAFEKGPP